jgi:2-polyprenyl-3-methyl-5-hydroxy-6-metoxy-1,4-benzoquinol methylase
MNPQIELLKLSTGYWASRAIYVAAKLKVADLLKDGPRPSADLAKATNTHPHALYRLLRALASIGIFAEDKGKFGLTPLAEALRSDVPGSQWAVAVMMGDEHFRVWEDLLYSIETGKPAFDKAYGKPPFDYLAEHPESAKLFDAAMTGIHGNETKAMLDAFSFAGFAALVDIGGGNGSLLTAVLRQTPSLKGTLYDLPHVIERAKPNIHAAGVGDRCTMVAGSFFESVPTGYDAYLMRHIIHDWDDEKALTILRNCRKAIKPTGKLLLIEAVIPPGNDPSWSKFLDLNMLLIPGGQERTEAEYRQLYTAAGFRLTRIVPTTTEISVIEGEPA